MWIWNGVICPEPGEFLDRACREAIDIAAAYGAGSKLDYRGESFGPYFEFTFNNVRIRVWKDSTVEELKWQWESKRAAQ